MERPLRVAVCISGQMRNYRDCVLDNLDNLIRPLSADVFIHTWDRVGMTTCVVGYLPHHVFACLPDPFHRDVSDFFSDTAPSIFETAFPTLYHYLKERTSADSTLQANDLKTLYGARECVVENYASSTITDRFDMPRLRGSFQSTYLNMIPMFYKIWACDELRRKAEREDGRPYDVVIRTRPDFLIKGSIPEPILRTQPIGTLFNPGLSGAPDCVFDAFAIGDSGGMTYYSSLWEKLPSYLDERMLPEVPIQNRAAERLLYYHLAEIGAEGNFLKIDPSPARQLEILPFETCISLMEKDLDRAKSLFPDAEEWLIRARRIEAAIA